MIERVHEHIIAELQQNTRTDTIFLLTAIILNLLTMGINSAVAGSSRGNRGATEWTVFFIFIGLLIVVNFVVEIGIIKGRQSRVKLINGLIRMYKDQGVEGYYDPSLLANYNTRYNLFLLAVMLVFALGLSACERSAMQNIPLPTPTTGGETTYTFTGTENPIAMLYEYATQTALAAGGGAGGIPAATMTPTPITGTQVAVITSSPQTFVAPSLTPSPFFIIPTPTVGRPTTYSLQRGEFPFCIARRFNVDQDELMALNPQIANVPENQIAAGTVLTIPQTGHPFRGERRLNPHPTTYTVAADVTIYKVACYFGDLEPLSIAAANNLPAPYTLHLGQILNIP